MAESCRATTRLVMRLQAARAGSLSAPVVRLPGRSGHAAGAIARLAAAVGRMGRATTRPVMAARFRLPERSHNAPTQALPARLGEMRAARAIQSHPPVSRHAGSGPSHGEKGEPDRRWTAPAVMNNPAPAPDRNGRDEKSILPCPMDHAGYHP
ncbi:hypothetical protein RI056_15105 [Komagataeibacter nataicola]|uniref:hypothetical protein n=1 Tax=Komagataeibacter nataicola TaxID=265960 RepID=UPI0028AB262C|nr:hypothetical protein [Komagataeibacter nataicola]WNM08205.1 hypothetical protein RI056_15105 [Komagataeibacter nataicola]